MATNELQKAMDLMLGDLGRDDENDWCHLLFDNILIGGDTPADCHTKLKLFLERAAKHNVYLKLEKTWLGYKEVKFFGYKVREGQFYLDEDRSTALDLVKFPAGNTAQKITTMRSFLVGQTRIFQQHVPDYTDRAHHGLGQDDHGQVRLG